MPKATQPLHHDHLPMFILDVLRHDIESVETAVHLLNDDSGTIGWLDNWPRDFTADDVVEGIRSLLGRGYLIAYRVEGSVLVRDPSVDPDTEEIKRLWFASSELGLQAWESWQPPDG